MGPLLYQQGHLSAQVYSSALSTKSLPLMVHKLELSPSLDMKHQTEDLFLSLPCPYRDAFPLPCFAHTSQIIVLKLHLQPSMVIWINSPCGFFSWFLSANQESLVLYHFTNITPFPGIILAA